MGMSSPGEIQRLSCIVKPNIGIITSVDYAHSQFFNTIYDIIKDTGKKDFNWKLSNRDPWVTQIEWDIQWADVAPALERWKEMKPFQKINHFPGMYQIARKNYLARNLNKMQKQFP